MTDAPAAAAGNALDRAREALRRGDPARAGALFAEAARHAPDDADAPIGAARAALLSGAPDAALDWVARALALDPGRAGAHVLHARAALAVGDLRAAAAAADRARACAPRAPEPVLVRARLFHVSGELEAEIALLADAAGPRGARPRLSFALAEALMNLGRDAEARAALERLDPRALNAAQLFRLCGLWNLCGRPDRAREALDLLPEDAPEAPARALTAAQAAGAPPARARAAYAAAAGDTAPEPGLFARLTGRAAARAAAALRPRYAEAEAYWRAVPPAPAEAARVSLLCPIHRAADARNLIAQIRRRWPNLEAVVVNSAPGLSAARLRRALARAPLARLEVLDLPPGTPLPECLNRGLAAARGDWIARFDADDRYLPGYLARTLGLMRAHDAALCGRSDLFVHLGGAGAAAFFQRQAGPYALAPARGSVGSGSSMVMTRAAAQRLGFDPRLARGEDRQAYLRAHALGLRCITAPPFDHLVIRSPDPGAHTWRVADLQLLRAPSRLLAPCGAAAMERALAACHAA